MIEIGRLCIKLAGREAGKKAVIVDILDGNFVLIDGNVKRRKCNINHLELLSEKMDIKKGAASEEVRNLFKEMEILEKREPKIKNKRERKGGKKPKKIRPRIKEKPKKTPQGREAKKTSKEAKKSPQSKEAKKTSKADETERLVEEALSSVDNGN